MMRPIVALSTEQYSDYQICGYFLVPSVEFVNSKLAEWGAAHPEQEGRHNARFGDFVEWLEKQPGVTLFDGISEIWIGGYHTWSNEDERLGL